MRHLIIFLTAALLTSCGYDPSSYTLSRQIISPKSLTYQTGDSIKNVSITHTCTCPFPWSVNVLTPSAVLIGSTGNGDNSNVPIKIDRSQLTVDTLRGELQVKSAFGTDTIVVMVIR
ncbi:MAG: hypothetical protein ABI778_00705 [Ignavibacteriota bacterium]